MTANEDEAQFSIHMTVTIRQMTAEDLPKLEWFGEFEHFRNLFKRSYREQVMGRRYMLVADCNGFPIGRLFIQLASQNRRIADGHNRGYLYSFHVMTMFRGQGIGSRLIQAAETVLLARDYHLVTLAVAKDNENALRLYQRHGYQIFSEDDGKWRYIDHRGHVREVDEPCWLLKKVLKENELLDRKDG